MSCSQSPLEAARSRMRRVDAPNQVLGRAQPIGCTAVEITQRCNLDCTLCYLSEHSEAVRDLPLDAVYRRLDDVRATYGPRVHVQITGGEPTLRKHDELVAIVAHARRIGLYPALFTNGIACSRRLLERLAQAGLEDVAFHVDTTQRRAGYASEAELDGLRREYLARAEGLGLTIIFNTTVHEGNVGEVPALVRFFVDNADRVSFASFQLQADTGRGEWGAAGPLVSLDAVRSAIDAAAGRRLPWDAVRVGHPHCHCYVPALVAGGQVMPVIEDAQLFGDLLADFGGIGVDRHMPLRRIIGAHLRVAARKPRWIGRALAHGGRLLWRHRRALAAARGRLQRLSFFVHDFMDAAALDPERVEACSFMVMTEAGPVSMCEHNARRDEFILAPVTVFRRDGSRYEFQPLGDAGGRRPGRVAAGVPA